MDNKYNSAVSALILICELILVAIAVLFVIHFFPDWPALAIVIANIGGLIFLYTLLRFRQAKSLNKNLLETASVLDAISEDLNRDVYLLNKEAEFEGFYKQIELFREKLKKKEDDRQQIFSLVNSIAVNMEIEKLFDDLMPKLIDVSGSSCCAFYIANNITNRLEIKASLGFNKNLYSEFDLNIGEGIIGGAIKSKETKIIKDIPDDTIYVIRSVLGKLKPKSMMIVPVFNQDHLLAVIALASIYDYTQAQLQMVDMMKYYIGVAIANGLAYEKTIRLTNELKFQNKLIQSLNDELEKSVLERTKLMNEVLDSIKNEAIFALNINCDILAWNTGAEETLDYKAQEVIGKHIDVVFPDDVVKTGIIREQYEKAVRNGRNVVNFWRQKSNGTRIFVEMLIFARYNINGDPAGYTTVIKDITHLTNLWMFAVEEDVIEDAMKQSKKSIIYADADGIIRYASDAAAEMLSEDKPSGRNISDFFENNKEFMTRTSMMHFTSGIEQWRQKLKHVPEPVLITVSVMLSPKTYTKMLFILIEQTEDEQ